MVVSAPFSDTWLHDADFLCRVTDTWSHRYNELLLVYCVQLLPLAGSHLAIFIQ